VVGRELRVDGKESGWPGSVVIAVRSGGDEGVDLDQGEAGRVLKERWMEDWRNPEGRVRTAPPGEAVRD
jgi:hypothetical protein